MRSGSIILSGKAYKMSWKNLNRYELIRGISQEYLSSEVEANQQRLLRIEKGSVTPRIEALERIVLFLTAELQI